jgi:hypothetical protein
VLFVSPYIDFNIDFSLSKEKTLKKIILVNFGLERNEATSAWWSNFLNKVILCKEKCVTSFFKINFSILEKMLLVSMGMATMKDMSWQPSETAW